MPPNAALTAPSHIPHEPVASLQHKERSCRIAAQTTASRKNKKDTCSSARPGRTHMLTRLYHNAALALATLLSLCVSMQACAGSMVHSGDADQAAGDIFQYLLPAVGLGASAYLGDKEGMKEWGYSMGATMLATTALKAGFNSTSLGERPNGGQHSFPSGHTSMACAGAAFIGERYGWDLGAVAMVPAAFVGWSRVDEDMHHWRDVIAGCALGAGLSMYFTKPDDKHQFTILPDIGDHSFALGFTMKY